MKIVGRDHHQKIPARNRVLSDWKLKQLAARRTCRNFTGNHLRQVCWRTDLALSALWRLAWLPSWCSEQTAIAQSTIFTVPTTDTVEKNKVCLEFDGSIQAPEADGSDRLYLFLPRAVVGLGHDVEAGANVAVVHQGASNNLFFQPNIKWQFFNDEKTGMAASVGGILYVPINNRQGVDTYGLLYANLSRSVGKYGPRLTVGPYGVVGGTGSFVGPKAGAIAGFEQPIHPKVSIVADWFSGKNSFGYFTPGVSITLPRKELLNAGYSIGNDSYNGNLTRNRLVFLHYEVTF